MPNLTEFKESQRRFKSQCTFLHVTKCRGRGMWWWKKSIHSFWHYDTHRWQNSTKMWLVAPQQKPHLLSKRRTSWEAMSSEPQQGKAEESIFIQTEYTQRDKAPTAQLTFEQEQSWNNAREKPKETSGWRYISWGSFCSVSVSSHW